MANEYRRVDPAGKRFRPGGRFWARSWVGVLASWAVCLDGCAHARNNFAEELAQVHYPSWVYRGSGAAKVAETRNFFGVGQVAGMRNAALARSTADNRARAELAKSFEIYAAGVLAAWVSERDAAEAKSGVASRAEPTGGGGVTLVAAPSEMSSEQLVKILAAAALPAVQITDHWLHPDDGAIFSLAALDLQQLIDNLGRVRELRPQLRSWLVTHLPQQHDLVSEEKLRLDASLTGAVPQF